MPKSMTDDVANVIVHALQRGLSRKDIAGVVGVSRRAITRISTNLRLHGAPKAPPSGLKQGRPIKMTEGQAHAMLGWIAGRNHTFFIKDLTQFLKDNHGFQGCDGTVRRALIRAGYKRKLPWHKSEITAWVPPDGPPDLSFVMHVNNTPRKPQSNARQAPSTNANATGHANEDALMSEELQQLEESTQAGEEAQSQPLQVYQLEHSSGIDPALEAATVPPPGSLNAPYPTSPTNARQSHVPSVEPVGSQHHITSSSRHPINSSILSLTSPQSEQIHSLPLQEGLATTAARSHIRDAQAATPQGQHEPLPQPDSAMISSLQQENARQRELIAQLQRQLAQGSPTPAEAALAALADSAAATATAAMHVQSQQQEQQDQQLASPATDDQSAVRAKVEEPEDASQGLAQTTDDRVRRLQALIDSRDAAQGRPRHNAHSLNSLNQNGGNEDEEGEEDDFDDDDDDDAV